jgi:hypothetical protein
MKKIIASILLITVSFFATAQTTTTPKAVVAVFPYQQISEANQALDNMGQWQAAEWKSFFALLEDSSQKIKASYALHAYVNKVALISADRNSFVRILEKQIKKSKSANAKILLTQELNLLHEDAYVKERLALTYPKQSEGAGKAFVYNPNNTQLILDLQKSVEKNNNPLLKKELIWKASKMGGISSFMLVAKFLDDETVKNYAASALAKIVLNSKEGEAIHGKEIHSILEKTIGLIHGEDSAYLAASLTAYLKKLPYDYGFEPMFNGKDLSGWKGLVGNPIYRSKQSDSTMRLLQEKANSKAANDWIVKDGLLIFTGHGDNLCTEKKYGDFEMYVDWKITEQGDAGIYLRGTPQVQIWDTSRREVGAQVGSGGLYNNQKNKSTPLVVADNKIGEWNTFHIIMKGEKVTVWLNGILVTDNIVLENYWDHAIPIFNKEQIELQAHGTYVAYRNLYIREIPDDIITQTLSEEETKAGFVSLFDGTNIDKWMGNTAGYQIKDGAVVVMPDKGSGGNLYTKEEYRDFIYRFEFQLTPGANNGIGIHAPPTGDAAYVGMEIQVLDSEHPMYADLFPYQYHGSVYGIAPAKRGYLLAPGEWNKEEIMIKGDFIKVTLNGTVINELNIKEVTKNGTMDHKDHPGLLRTSGHIGFLGHGDVVRFKNMRIKSL